MKEQSYSIDGHKVSNLEVQLLGAVPGDGAIVLGAHYDSADGTVGADDNASGVAALLELARILREAKLRRTVRFVFFVNEEPPYFQTSAMGSLVYVRALHNERTPIAAMISLETLGFYSDVPGSQNYPPILRLFYPSRGNFIGFVANSESRSLVRQVLRDFRGAAQFPSEGIAAPSTLPGIGWSDHWSFWQLGYPAIMVWGKGGLLNASLGGRFPTLDFAGGTVVHGEECTTPGAICDVRRAPSTSKHHWIRDRIGKHRRAGCLSDRSIQQNATMPSRTDNPGNVEDGACALVRGSILSAIFPVARNHPDPAHKTPVANGTSIQQRTGRPSELRQIRTSRWECIDRLPPPPENASYWGAPGSASVEESQKSETAAVHRDTREQDRTLAVGSRIERAVLSESHRVNLRAEMRRLYLPEADEQDSLKPPATIASSCSPQWAASSRSVSTCDAGLRDQCQALRQHGFD